MESNGFYSRTECLIGSEAMKKLSESKVLVCGLGGVGGYAFEALVRAGIGTIGVIDSDVFDESNLNRQILAVKSTIGCKKTAAAEKRAKEINPDCRVWIYDAFYSSETADEIPLSQFDYIVDAIDTVSSKILLAEKAAEACVPLISVMGTGNKLGTKFQASDINDTSVCPLARVMRRELKARGIENVKAVYSLEEPIRRVSSEQNGRHAPASISYPPGIAGLIAAGEVIKYLIEK